MPVTFCGVRSLRQPELEKGARSPALETLFGLAVPGREVCWSHIIDMTRIGSGLVIVAEMGGEESRGAVGLVCASVLSPAPTGPELLAYAAVLPGLTDAVGVERALLERLFQFGRTCQVEYVSLNVSPTSPLVDPMRHPFGFKTNTGLWPASVYVGRKSSTVD